MPLSAIDTTRKTGSESFITNNTPLPFTLLDFWQWSSSDLVGNAMRGVLAEYIVASAVGCTGGSRTEWDAYDIETDSGIKIEVKSASYIQSWKQVRYSDIIFGIAPTQSLIGDTQIYSEHKVRQADVYVFCVLAHKDQDTINPLNLDQWDVYVISTEVLNEVVGEQKTIGLQSLLKLSPKKTNYEGLGESIERSAGK